MRRRAILGTALALAVAATAAGCASGGARPRPFPTPAGDRPGTPATPNAIVATALTLQGVPYRFGGTDLRGFDCSGLVQYVFLQHGVGLPRVVREQYDVGTRVSRNRVRPGDLVFFATKSRAVSHVGIAIGNGRFIHAPSERGVVRVESLASSYWSRRLVGARRVAAAGG
jgi:cell wall-associated NlpC family hydrolase